jgi:putative transposase
LSPCGGIEIAEWPRPCRAPWPWAASDNPSRGGGSRGASRQGGRPGRRGEIPFTSSILPKWARRTKSLDPLSTGDFQEALSALLGKDAPNLSPAVISLLTAEWQTDYDVWQKRDLSAPYVCMLVLIGTTPEARKELVGFQTGVRESAQSWRELLIDIKQRGLEASLSML